MSSAHAKKVILFASKPYSSKYESLLLSIIERRVELFCAAGVDSENWELAIDLLLTDPARSFSHHITTTSHSNEPREDVLNLASLWFVAGGSEVEIIEIM